MSKEQALLFDIHGTLLDKKGNINKNLYEMVRCLSDEYYILLITASKYANQHEFMKDIENLLDIGDGYYYNHTNYKDDGEIKKFIYEHQIKLTYEVCAIIDNNKDVIKEFRKIGIDTLRFKGHQ